MNIREQLDRDRLIHNLGLDRQVRAMDTLLPALGIFSAGLLVGVGMGLLLAPKSGRELRGDITHGINDLTERSQHAINEAAERARTRIDQIRSGDEAPAGGGEGGENPYS